MKSTIRRYERELVGSVIPFWENHCVDREYGGFLICLDRDGDPYDTTKHLWMQWRTVYMFAALAETRFAGDRRERWLEIARQGFRFLVDHGRDAEGAYYFALNREGQPIVAPYSTGSDFFAIMGCAALFKATGDEECREATARASGTSGLRRAPDGALTIPTWRPPTWDWCWARSWACPASTLRSTRRSRPSSGASGGRSTA